MVAKAKWHYIGIDRMGVAEDSAIAIALSLGIPVWEANVSDLEGKRAIAIQPKDNPELAAVLKKLGIHEPVWRAASGVFYLIRAEKKKVRAVPLKKQTIKEMLQIYLETRKLTIKITAKGLEDQLTIARKNATSFDQKLVEQYSLITALMQKIETTKSGENLEDRMMGELETMTRHPIIESIRVDEAVMTIRTNEIVHLKTGVPFGLFTIKINVHTATILSVINDTPVQTMGEIYQHPHFPGKTGNMPCWGSVSQERAALVAQRDIPGLLNFLLEFLQSVNMNNDHWYQDVFHVFEKRAKESKMLREKLKVLPKKRVAVAAK